MSFLVGFVLCWLRPEGESPSKKCLNFDGVSKQDED